MNLSKYKALLVIFLLSFRVVVAENIPPTPAFDNEPEIFSNTGHYKLLWKIENSETGEIEFELQRAQDSTFTNALTIYKGPDLGSFISGLKNGKYFFRVRAVEGSTVGVWSQSPTHFRSGDFIRVKEYFGRVTERGLLDTEIQTETRELISIPNAFLISNPVQVIRSSGTISKSARSSRRGAFIAFRQI